MNKFEGLLSEKKESPEMKRRKYEMNLKLADMSEIGFFKKLLGRGLKSEDIMIEEAYQQNDLMEKRREEMKKEGKTDEEIKKAIDAMNKNFENIDIFPKEVNVLGFKQMKLIGNINGHMVGLVRSSYEKKGEKKESYIGKIDGKEISRDEAEGLYKEYERFSLLKKEAMDKARE